MGRNWWIEEKQPNVPMYIDKAPPVRVIAVITLLASTLDIFADVILAIYLGRELRTDPPLSCIARNTSYAYFFFVSVTMLVYVIELIDCITTIKNNQETRWLSILSKSLGLVFEEVPLPTCLLIIFSFDTNHGASLASPMKYGSAIKFIALTWGIVKYIKFRFCWFFYPCCGGHEFGENVRRCFTPTLYRLAMIMVNLCHVLAITVCVVNIIIASGAGRPFTAADYPPCNY